MSPMPTAGSSIRRSSTHTHSHEDGGPQAGSSTMKTQWIAVGSLLIASLAGGATARASAPAATRVAHVCGVAAPGTAECLADVVSNRPIASSNGTIAGYVAAQ